MAAYTLRYARVAALLCLSLIGTHGGGGFFAPQDARKQPPSGTVVPRQVPPPQQTEAVLEGLGLDGSHKAKGTVRGGPARLAAAAAAALGRAETRAQPAATPQPSGRTDAESSVESVPGYGTLASTAICTRSPLSGRRLPWGQTSTHDWKREALLAAGRWRRRRSAALGLTGGEVRSAVQHAGETRGGASTPPPHRANAVEGIKNGFASGLAAACVKTVLQPFDTMKTVQQFSTTRMTLLQAGRDLLARGGVRELYQGLGVTLVGSMPSVGVYFGLYQFVKKQMDGRENMSPYVSIVVSAGVGNFVASFFRVPYEVVKQRMQVGAYPTTMVALESIYRQGGLWGFFGKGGLKTQWARDIPYAMVTLLVYETLQKAAARRRGPEGAKKGSVLENMVIGAVAGGMGSLVTNPMDMIKTRMMTSPETYAGPMDAAWMALRKEGPQAFMKGATPRLLHKIPANGLFFVVYEFFRNMLGVTR